MNNYNFHNATVLSTVYSTLSKLKMDLINLPSEIQTAPLIEKIEKIQNTLQTLKFQDLK